MAFRFLLLASYTFGQEKFTIPIDEGFDDLEVVKARAEEAKEEMTNGKTIVLESRTIPEDEAMRLRGSLSNEFPRVLHRYFIIPYVFQQTLGSEAKIELNLPLTMAQVSDKEACIKADCVEEILNNGPGVFRDVARNQAALAGRFAILSNACGKVKLADNLEPVLASEIGKDAEEEGPHRSWGKLAETIQTTADIWLTSGYPAAPVPGDDHKEDSWFSGWFAKLGIFCGIIPLMAWLAFFATQHFTRPRPIAAPLLGDVRLDEGDACEVKFEGRKVTEYSSLNV